MLKNESEPVEIMVGGVREALVFVKGNLAGEFKTKSLVHFHINHTPTKHCSPYCILKVLGVGGSGGLPVWPNSLIFIATGSEYKAIETQLFRDLPVLFCGYYLK